MKKIMLLIALNICSMTFSMNDHKKNLHFPSKEIMRSQLEESKYNEFINKTNILEILAHRKTSFATVGFFVDHACETHNTLSGKMIFTPRYAQDFTQAIVKTALPNAKL